ncbi:hypothetical protein GSI_04949 [Ganoderma sinense ZZ0214-1]|uniref:Uncharacterized protein n=1 Tax=Ganoderma sinense ZZ0214-1 TaxID=1077348 RepID=A0A2G8SGF2_9APHY|nr:hypothetical protein GSI_04949 [Ganoderma sinense ZZ0214-1]
MSAIYVGPQVLSFLADVWAQTAIEITSLPVVASDLVPRKVQSLYQAPENLPSPLNCGSSVSLSPTLSTSVDLGTPISSFLIYNGSIYFLFLATLYTLDIILTRDSLPAKVRNAAAFMETFVDPITSILTCHFMLSLREFDSTAMSAGTTTFAESRDGDPGMAMTMLQFGAQPSESLPSFIASFAHPVHVETALFESETDSDTPVDDGCEWREMDVVAPTLLKAQSWSPAPGQPYAYK